MGYIPLPVEDESTFVEGTTGVVPVGGEFNDSSPDLAAGKVAVIRLTKKRGAHVNLRDSSGVELGTVGNPVNVTSPAGGTAVTVSDGADVAEGDTTDAAVVSDIAGTVSGKLRGLVKIFADVWDSVNHRLRVNATQGTPGATGSAWPTTVTDLTNTAAVKPASSATAAADPSLVVALSPNSPLPTFADRTATGTITAVPQSVTMACDGLGTATVEITGVWGGNLIVEGIALGGGLIANLLVYDVVNDTWLTAGATFTVNKVLRVNVTGLATLKVASIIFSSGTATVSIKGSQAAAQGLIESIRPGTGAQNLGKAENAGHTTGNVGGLMLTVRNDAGAAAGLAAATLRYQALQTDSSGNLKTVVNAALPAGSNNIGITSSEVQTDYDTGAGTQNLSMIGLALPASGGAVQGGTATNPLRVDPTGTTAQPVSGTVTANQGGAPWSVSQSGSPWGVSGTVTANQGGAPWSVTSTETRPGSTVTVIDLLSATDATRVLTILAANAARRGATIRNDTDAFLMLCEGGNASPVNYTDVLPPGARYVLDYPASTGILTAYLPQVPNGRLLATERA